MSEKKIQHVLRKQLKKPPNQTQTKQLNPQHYSVPALQISVFSHMLLENYTYIGLQIYTSWKGRGINCKP